jgi:hypothetical protein
MDNHDKDHDGKLISISDLPCCPMIKDGPCCDRLTFKYRLVNRLTDIPVEVTLVVELERCPGPLSLGDVIYSTTLLPGEKVRLFSSSRNTRFTFDSENKVSYRHEQASEESYYMSAMDHFMSDLTVKDQGGSVSTTSGSFNTTAGTSGFLESIFSGPSASVSGNFNGRSTFDFARELSSHAESSHNRSVRATHTANSVQMGEVTSRTHAEGETEDAYESASRTFENHNQCHAVTYFAYQLVKEQTVTLRIKAVLRRVLDPAADTRVETRVARPVGEVAVIPQGVLATADKRLDIQALARTSAAAERLNVLNGSGAIGRSTLAEGQRLSAITDAQPISEARAAAALKAVDDDLVKSGVLAANRTDPGEKLRAEFEFSRTTCLPTQGVVVKGCLDKCSVCEEELEQSIKLDLKRKELENDLLAKQIELLEKSQEYRCCPCDKEDAEA